MKLESAPIVGFSKTLEIPIQEFLPETITLNNTNHQNSQGGLILGNIYNYNYEDRETVRQLEAKDKEIAALKTEIQNLKEINALLREKRG